MSKTRFRLRALRRAVKLLESDDAPKPPIIHPLFGPGVREALLLDKTITESLAKARRKKKGKTP